MRQVHRICSLLLLIVMSLPTITVALAGSQLNQLPQCCRRDGKHKCVMQADAENETAGSVSMAARCPCVPSLSYGMSDGGWAVPSSANSVSRSVPVFLAAQAQTDALLRISAIRSRQKRGPPALSLSLAI
jgi:hypothetical protein